MTDPQKSEIVVVLDRSGSMTTTKADAEGGLREFIAKQKALPGGRLTFYRFDDEVERVFEDRPLEQVEDHELRLEPRGSTALLDAMMRAISEVGYRLNRTPEYDRPAHVYFVTITDGYENASIATAKDVFDKVKHQREKYNWQFVFIGANQDAIASASKLGIDAGSSISYKAGRIGTRNVYASLTSNMVTARATGQSLAFNDSDRKSALEDDVVVPMTSSTTGK